MTCPTYLLDDIPRPKDDLAPDGEGAHDRVARAMADLIQSDEPGGVLIGLEGRWGSGKSTVISLMQERLKDESATTFFIFDAWAHERDPLRRSFLESLIRHFQDAEWVDRASWDNVLAQLAKRRKVTTTRTIPKTTPFGKQVLWAALSVPLGTALVAGSLQRGVTIDSSLPVNWLLLIGISLSIAPFFVILLKLLRASTTHSKRAQHDDTRQDAEDANAVSEWALLAGHAITETRQDTTETPEPTSIEFEYEFKRLMRAALPSSKPRRAVLVLDNLDRVAPQDALSMWSTLQTFLQDRSTEAEKWFKKLWIVVPYDKSGLRRLWTVRNADSSEAKGVASDGVAESFIDKSFQIRFEVPPPVLSNWKLYLSLLVREALPAHTEESHDIYRVFNDQVVKQTRPPTPRELKLYVNQIGVLHRQWEHHFPISHLAYYSALRKNYATHDDIRAALVTGQVPAPSLAAVLPQRLGANLAGMLFNVRANVGEQLLLGKPIYQALVEKKVDALQNLQRVHQEGFWVVLEDVLGSRVRDLGPETICPALECLGRSSLLRERSDRDVRSAIRAVEEAVRNVKSWSPVTPETVLSIAAGCRMVAGGDLSVHVLDSLRRTLVDVSAAGEEVSTDARALIEPLARLASDLRALGHEEAISVPFVLPSEGNDWIDTCAEISKQAEWTWALFRPEASFVDIGLFLQGRIERGEISEAVLSAIRVSKSHGIVDQWVGVVKSVEKRLGVDYSVGTTEGTLLLRALALCQIQELNEAQPAAARLSDPGHLLHLFYEARQANHAVCSAWCLVMFLQQRPHAEVPGTAGNSDAGHDELEQVLATDDQELVTEVIDVITELDDLKLLFSVVDARDQYDAFVLTCLRQVADSANQLRLYTPDETIERWWDLREHLPDQTGARRFSTLIEGLCAETALVARLQEREFRADDAGLYRAVLETEPEENFVEFCRAGLEAVESEGWATELLEGGELLFLLTTLQARDGNVSLKQPFQDAIVDYAKVLLTGTKEPSQEFVDKRLLVFSPLRGGGRRILRNRLRDVAIEGDGKCANGFFQVFGEEIARSRLRDGRDIVAKLFSGLVRERVTGGLQWLHSVLGAQHGLLDQFSDKDAVADFRERVQREISKEKEEHDEAGRLIEDIAHVLGIEPASAEQSPDEEADRSDSEEDSAL